MGNLTTTNSFGHIVSSKCPYLEGDRGCNSSSRPFCEACAFVGRDEIRKIFKKLYRYEQTGLVFKHETQS